MKLKLDDIDWVKMRDNAGTVGACSDNTIMEMIDTIEHKCGHSPNVIKRIGNHILIGYVDEEYFSTDHMAFARINFVKK